MSKTANWVVALGTAVIAVTSVATLLNQTTDDGDKDEAKKNKLKVDQNLNKIKMLISAPPDREVKKSNIETFIQNEKAATLTKAAKTAKPKTTQTKVKKSVPNKKQDIFIDNCKKALTASGLKSPYISARKINDSSWAYTVPISFHHKYECDESTCFDGSYTVRGTHINVSLKYGGDIGANNIKVGYSYLDRKAEGSGECNNGEINYSYVFTAGSPTGSKGVAKIGLR